MARRRHLRPEEEEIWSAVARTTTPLHLADRKAKISLHPEVRLAGVGEKAKAPITETIEHFRIGERAVTALGHGISGQVGETAVRMDAKAFARMIRGKLVPEARIDLHGMTLSEAHPALISFIMNAYSQKVRLVLVITGKGRATPEMGGFPGRGGVLKHQVPQWLAQSPMSQAVQQVALAHLRHGGGGAYYVYLRRPR